MARATAGALFCDRGRGVVARAAAGALFCCRGSAQRQQEHGFVVKGMVLRPGQQQEHCLVVRGMVLRPVFGGQGQGVVAMAATGP